VVSGKTCLLKALASSNESTVTSFSSNNCFDFLIKSGFSASTAPVAGFIFLSILTEKTFSMRLAASL